MREVLRLKAAERFRICLLAVAELLEGADDLLGTGAIGAVHASAIAKDERLARNHESYGNEHKGQDGRKNDPACT
jgi:hypothetical protein